MGDKDLSQVESVFHAALDLPAAERPAFLAQACGGNESLYEEVCSLVSVSDNSGNFLEQPALNHGFGVLAQSSLGSMTGKVIRSYKVLSRLGKGGMGEVYLAEDTKLDRKVALKFLSEELVNDKWAKRQFAKEAQAVAQLEHPNICSVYDFEDSQDHCFIVMQYVEGETLADLIRKNRIQPNQILEITRQIVAALSEAHAHGIIHRDIKPRNIMVTNDGQVKVLDFGLAKIVRQKDGREIAEKSISLHARDGILAGTVAYMSPEQLRGDRLDFRSDIFSLGTVLYELIEKQNPFLRASEAETISAILTFEPLAIDRRNSHVNGLAHLVTECLAKDRDKRCQSASELLLNLSSNSKKGFWQRRNRHPLSWTIGTALLIFITIAFAISLLSNLVAPTAIPNPANTAPSPAVASSYSLLLMPITSDRTRQNTDYLTEGLSESLTHKLSSLSQARIVPYRSVSDEGKTVDPVALGKQFGFDAVLVGHIVHQQKTQRLQSRLLSVSDGTEIMNREIEIEWKNILELPDELARSVSKALELRLSDERKFLETHGTRSPEAFKQYMLGRFFWRIRDKDNIKKAIFHFREAIRLDPAYARPHAGLADSYVLLNSVAFGDTPTHEAMLRAVSAAQEAILLEDSLPEPHTSLGVISLRYEWRWGDAERHFRKAISLDDKYAPAHYWYSQLLLVNGRWQEAVAESERAKKLDPFSHPTVMNFCRTLSLSRQYDRAIACYDELLLENPKFDHGRYLRALVLQSSGRHYEALTELEIVYSRNRPLAGAALGYAYGKAGRPEDARTVLANMKNLSRTKYVPSFEFSIVHIGLGERDEAFAALQASYEERFATLIYIGVDPIFRSLYPDPRYLNLLRNLNLPVPAPE